MKGIIFDIKEFALNDGPGIRTTVFMKGCPLQCQWCHNPEGLIMTPQMMISETGRRLVGKKYEADSLATHLKKNADVFSDTGGGISFSGGEPLLQSDFLVEVLPLLDGIHILLDTSGYADKEVFREIVSKVQHVYYDLKLIDPELHLRWTGKTNEIILQNLLILDTMSVPYTIRVPLIPSVTDTRQNLEQIADVVHSLVRPQELNLLPYNMLAGGKYQSVGMEYKLDSDIGVNEEILVDIFSRLKIPVRILRDLERKGISGKAKKFDK